MYLAVLENYIVSLAMQAVDRPNKVKKVSIIVGELMDVMIQQEMLCPGIIFDGDEISKEVNRRVLAGMPFRDAYMQVSSEIESGTFSAERSVNHTHIGSIGNLGNDLIKQQFEKRMEVFG